MAQFLERKLRWVTLGGQYDWTKKQYPQESPPPFPPDIADLLQGIFPEMKAQAAIVNLYSPGDTLSMHRDVSEKCDNGLVSVSLGCDCVFVVGIEMEPEHGSGDEEMTQGTMGVNNEQESRKEVNMLALRLRSGDVIYMSGKARFAWHGVPKIMSGTCPEWLREWPAPRLTESNIKYESGFETFESWRGWMASKRINLNVRQMWL
jgi:alkylated DNA repair protein alkB homolog 1